MVKYKKKINKRFIILSKGESIGMMVLLSLIVILLAFSIFRPAMKLSENDRRAFHNLDSLLAVQEARKQASEPLAQQEAPHTATKPQRGESSLNKNGTQKDGSQKDGSQKNRPKMNDLNKEGFKKESFKKEGPMKAKASPIKPLDLNTADSTALLALPQIGSTMSSRIHRYRDRLGGFVALEQLFEVKGMDTARFETIRPYILLENHEIRKLNVNSDEFKVLLRHPYLEYEQVKAIVNYRERRGLIKQWSQLQGILGDCNPYLEQYLAY